MCYSFYEGKITTSAQREFNKLQKGPFTMRNANLTCCRRDPLQCKLIWIAWMSHALLMKQYDVLAKSSAQPTEDNLRYQWDKINSGKKKKVRGVIQVRFLFKGLNLQWIELLKSKDKSKRYEFYIFKRNFKRGRHCRASLLFGDEARFRLNDKVSYHKLRVWSSQNIH